jgi:hypothetical protein
MEAADSSARAFRRRRSAVVSLILLAAAVALGLALNTRTGRRPAEKNAEYTLIGLSSDWEVNATGCCHSSCRETGSAGSVPITLLVARFPSSDVPARSSRSGAEADGPHPLEWFGGTNGGREDAMRTPRLSDGYSYCVDGAPHVPGAP